MTLRLDDKIASALAELAHTARREILGLYADPVCLMQLERLSDGRSARPALRLGSDDEATFAGYPIRSSPREGVWAVLAPRSDDDRETEARLDQG